jgi:hypothetical protein
MHCLLTAYSLPPFNDDKLSFHCLCTAYSLPHRTWFSSTGVGLVVMKPSLSMHRLFVVMPIPPYRTLRATRLVMMSCHLHLFTAYSLPIHCLFTAYSLPIHCLFTALSLLVSLPCDEACDDACTVYSMSIHSLFTLYSLSIHSPLTGYSPSTQGLFTLH